MYISTQIGDKDLTKREETVQIKTPPLDNSYERTIWFKGCCLSIPQSALITTKPIEGLASRKIQITENVQYQLNKHNLIGVGVFTHVYCLDREKVCKIPAPDSNDLDLAIKSI